MPGKDEKGSRPRIPQRDRLVEAEIRRIAGLFNGNDRATKRIAVLFAVFFHVFLIAVTIPVAESPPPPQTLAPRPDVIIPPPFPRPPEKQPPEVPPLRDPSSWMVPVPDETPDDPEPIWEPEPDVGDFHGVATEPLRSEDWIGPAEPPPAPRGILYPGMEGVTHPEKIHHVDPVFPPMARTAGMEGRVILEAVIRFDGSVGEIRVLSGPDSRYGFAEAAVAAVSEWRYQPALQYGRPVSVYITIVVSFTLED
jgi:protein TonB